MAVRVPIQQCLRLSGNLPTISLCRAFSTSAPSYTQGSKETHRRKRRDPYAVEQIRARKAANLSRQKVLKAERQEALGDPIRGIETDFVRSFDDPPTQDNASGSADGQLNFYLKQNDLDSSIEKSKWLLTPTERPNDESSLNAIKSSESIETQRATREAEQENAAEALRRINKLSIGSSKDRLRVNVQRCISLLGRHNTDNTLPAKPGTADKLNEGTESVMPRIGQDTGSSEVQIGVLTAKIRTLTQFLETRGKMDKHNRRNLTILVHKRQKLLRYLQRKEKGGPRWQNLVQTLGLTDGTWRGEITLPRYI